MCVDIHGGVKVGVTKDLLNDLDIDVVLKQAGCESVTQGVAGEPGQQYRIFEFCQLLVIAIPDDPPESFVECSLVLAIPKSVDEDEIRKAVHSHAALDLIELLVRFLHQQGLFYTGEHGDLPCSRFGLGRMYVEIAAILSVRSVVVVDKSVVHRNQIGIEVNVFPTESGYFANTHPGFHHDFKHRIPVMIFDVLTFEIANEKLLLCNSQCFPVCRLNIVALLQFFQSLFKIF